MTEIKGKCLPGEQASGLAADLSLSDVRAACEAPLTRAKLVGGGKATKQDVKT